MMALPQELLVRVLAASPIDGLALARAPQVCREWRAAEEQWREKLWKQLCSRHGMQQTGTLRRGWVSWKLLYISLCCVECVTPAAYVLNIGTGM
eukprot:SAG31_NODE_10805_length_1095_cov_1.363454_1_plen_93_part_10